MSATEIVNGLPRTTNGRPTVIHEVMEFNRQQLSEMLATANQGVSDVIKEFRESIKDVEAAVRYDEQFNIIVETNKVVFSVSRSLDIKKDAPNR